MNGEITTGSRFWGQVKGKMRPVYWDGKTWRLEGTNYPVRPTALIEHSASPTPLPNVRSTLRA